MFTHVARVQLKAGLTFLNNGGKRNHKQSFKSVAAAHLSSKHEEHVVFNQMLWKGGLKKHGDKGAEAIMKEFSQLHDRETFVPVHRKDLTNEQRREALKSFMFLK